MLFASKQTNLRKVTCITVMRVNAQLFVPFVLSILKITSLQELQLFLYTSDIQWSASWFAALSESDVETVRLICSQISFPSISNSCYLLNTKLTCLAIRTNSSYHPDIVHWLVTLPNLRVLFLSHVNDVILNSICTNQVGYTDFLKKGNNIPTHLTLLTL